MEKETTDKTVNKNKSVRELQTWWCDDDDESGCGNKTKAINKEQTETKKRAESEVQYCILLIHCVRVCSDVCDSQLTHHLNGKLKRMKKKNTNSNKFESSLMKELRKISGFIASMH